MLERDAEYSYLALDRSDEGPMDQLREHSITYRIAVGPQQGCKVFTLQTLPGIEEPFSNNVNCAEIETQGITLVDDKFADPAGLLCQWLNQVSIEFNNLQVLACWHACSSGRVIAPWPGPISTSFSPGCGLIAWTMR